MPPHLDSSHRPFRALGSDERGSLSTEYAVLLVLVSVVGALALVSAGTPLVKMFLFRQTWLLLPFP